MSQGLLERPQDTPPQGVLRVASDESRARIEFESAAEVVDILKIDGCSFTFDHSKIGKLIGIDYPLAPDTGTCSPRLTVDDPLVKRSSKDRDFPFEVLVLIGNELLNELDGKTRINERHAVHAPCSDTTKSVRRNVHELMIDSGVALDSNKEFEKKLRDAVDGKQKVERSALVRIGIKLAEISLATCLLLVPALKTGQGLPGEGADLAESIEHIVELDDANSGINFVIDSLYDNPSDGKEDQDAFVVTTQEAADILVPLADTVQAQEALADLQQTTTVDLNELSPEDKTRLEERLTDQLNVNTELKNELEELSDEQSKQILDHMGLTALVGFVGLGIAGVYAAKKLQGPTKYVKAQITKK